MIKFYRFKKGPTPNQVYKILVSKLFLVVITAFGTTYSVQAQFARGADIGWLSEMEASGRLFYDANGVQKNLLDILPDYSINAIRLRVWVNPTNGYCNKSDVLAMALRAKAKGYRIMIDFHYSDSWADPGQQNKPAAWSTYTFNGLMNAVYNHTVDVLTTLKNNGITPEWVQVGNETNNGMLWNEGKATVSMQNFAWLINTGYDAVKSVSPTSKVIVHLANGNDNGLYRWMFDGLTTYSARYDVIGMSVYPSPTDWWVTTTQVLTNMNDMVARYNKEVMICEIGMSYTSPGAAKDFAIDIQNKVKSVANGKGLGVFWWEPQCYNWQGYDKGAFDLTGKPTIALQAFLYDSYNLPANPDFEADAAATQAPASWTEWSNGNLDAGKTEAGGYNGTAYKLTHYKATAYQMSTYQTKTGLPNGTYTLSAWVKSSGGQNACWIFAKNYGGTEKTTVLPAASTWTQIKITGITVTNGQCQFGLWSDANAGNWCNLDGIELYKSNSSTARVGSVENASETVAGSEQTKTFNAYPNPFSDQVSIDYILDTDAPVKITLCNSLGNESKVLLHEDQKAGAHSLYYKAATDAPGLYMIKIRYGQKGMVRKVYRVK